MDAEMCWGGDDDEKEEEEKKRNRLILSFYRWGQSCFDSQFHIEICCILHPGKKECWHCVSDVSKLVAEQKKKKKIVADQTN